MSALASMRRSWPILSAGLTIRRTNASEKYTNARLSGLSGSSVSMYRNSALRPRLSPAAAGAPICSMRSSSLRFVLRKTRSPCRAHDAVCPDAVGLSVMPSAFRSTMPSVRRASATASPDRTRMTSVRSVPSMKNKSEATSPTSVTSPDSRNRRLAVSARPRRRRYRLFRVVVVRARREDGSAAGQEVAALVEKRKERRRLGEVDEQSIHRHRVGQREPHAGFAGEQAIERKRGDVDAFQRRDRHGRAAKSRRRGLRPKQLRLQRLAQGGAAAEHAEDVRRAILLGHQREVRRRDGARAVELGRARDPGAERRGVDAIGQCAPFAHARSGPFGHELRIGLPAGERPPDVDASCGGGVGQRQRHGLRGRVLEQRHDRVTHVRRRAARGRRLGLADGGQGEAVLREQRAVDRDALHGRVGEQHPLLAVVEVRTQLEDERRAGGARLRSWRRGNVRSGHEKKERSGQRLAGVVRPRRFSELGDREAELRLVDLRERVRADASVRASVFLDGKVERLRWPSAGSGRCRAPVTPPCAAPGRLRTILRRARTPGR